MALRVGCVAILLGSLSCFGCDATVSGSVARVVNDPHSSSIGGGVEGRLHLPKFYGWVAGGETQHSGQLSPASPADQWRAGFLFGRNPLLRPVGSCLSYEVIAHLGFFRGIRGDEIARTGLYGGLNVGMPIRISGTRDPWELDDILIGTWSIVPVLTANALAPEFRFADTAVELGGSLALRVTLSSTLLP